MHQSSRPSTLLSPSDPGPTSTYARVASLPFFASVSVVDVDLATDKSEVVIAPPPGDPVLPGRFAISPDGRWMFLHRRNIATKTNDVYVTNILEGGEILQVTNDGVSAL